MIFFILAFDLLLSQKVRFPISAHTFILCNIRLSSPLPTVLTWLKRNCVQTSNFQTVTSSDVSVRITVSFSGTQGLLWCSQIELQYATVLNQLSVRDTIDLLVQLDVVPDDARDLCVS